MLRRVQALFRARLQAQLGAAALPAAPLLAHGSLTALLCLLVRGALDPFTYGLFALTLSAGLVALSLLGELGSLLRADPAAEWSEPLPARPRERRIAHGLVALVLLCVLALGSLLPAALCAPASMDLGQRLALLLAGLEQCLAIGASLLAFQLVFGERAEGALVLVQTLLVVAIFAGFLIGLRAVPALRELGAGREAWPSWIALFPPACFAAAAVPPPGAWPGPPPWLAHLSAPVSLLALLAAPSPRASSGRTTGTLLAALLAPFRALALRAWVARSERGAFELVYAALPLERDFVLRTYPMIGIPLAFLLAGARGEDGGEREGLLALLLFSPPVYLPVLVAHVCATASPRARWILDGAPLPAAAIRNGAIKALFLRFVLPLYLGLGCLALALGEGRLALLLGAPAALVSLAVLRRLYPRIVRDLPLSTAPDELDVRQDWMGLLLTLAVLLVALALLAQRFVQSYSQALLFTFTLLALEALADRRARRAQGAAPPQA